MRRSFFCSIFLSTVIIALLTVLTGCWVGSGQERLLEGREEIEWNTEEVSIYFFHDTACGTCDGTEEFLSAVSEQLSAFCELYPYKLYMYNVFKKDGWDAAEKILGEAGQQANRVSYPAMMVHGNIYEGMDEIRNNLTEAYLKNAESAAVYFYRSDCQECMDIKPYMDKLPERIFIEGTEVPFQLFSLNSREGDNRERIQELFVEYDVPEEDQMVPIVFLKDGYLAGREEIEKRLLEMLEQGHGLGTLYVKKTESMGE